MQVINIEWLPDGDRDPIGCDNLFLVDVPDSEFDEFLDGLEDSVNSYLENVDDADEQSPAEIAENVMRECGRHYMSISRIGHIKV